MISITELEKQLREKGHLLSDDYDEYHFGCCVVRTDAMTAAEIVRHFQKMAARRNVKFLPAKLSTYYLTNVIKEFFANPASLIRRFRTFLKVIRTSRGG